MRAVLQAFLFLYLGKYFISSLFIHYLTQRLQDGVHTSFAPISLCVTTLAYGLHGLLLVKCIKH